jgi:hypothetical protein
MIDRDTHVRLRLAGLVLASIVLSAAGPETISGNEPERLTVVELFTSQGCSSCPPADALLGELAERPGILALSLPVDYWDYLGWRDTLARPEHKARQYAYAKRLGVDPYTPQVVIDGAFDVVGSKRNNVLRIVDVRRQSLGDRVPVSVLESPEELVINVAAGKARSATVYLVRFKALEEVVIHRGENRGKAIRYAHVVRELRPLGAWDGSAVSFHVARAGLTFADDERFAVILQGNGAGPILGAAELPKVE